MTSYKSFHKFFLDLNTLYSVFLIAKITVLNEIEAIHVKNDNVVHRLFLVLV